MKQTVLPALVIFISPALWSHPAQCASFNCKAAKTRAEKLICSDKTLSKLDDDLAEIYRRTVKTAEKPDDVKTSQRNWLREIQAQCKTAACLESGYKARIKDLKTTKNYEWQTYQNTDLGVAFQYPSNCKVSAKGKTIILLGPGQHKNDYIVELEIYDRGYEKTLAENGDFKLQDGKWVADIGRFGPTDAKDLRGEGWKGLSATVTCGVDDPKTGFHAAGGECLWAVLGNESQSLVADTQGADDNNDIAEKLLKSFRFEKKPQKK